VQFPKGGIDTGALKDKRSKEYKKVKKKGEKVSDDVGVQRALGSAYDPHGNLESCSSSLATPTRTPRKLKVNSIEQSVGIPFPLPGATCSSPQINLAAEIRERGGSM
jgi:hypothetical protein